MEFLLEHSAGVGVAGYRSLSSMLGSFSCRGLVRERGSTWVPNVGLLLLERVPTFGFLK